MKPGKGPAFVRTKLKDISSGKIIDETFNAGMKLDFLKIEALVSSIKAEGQSEKKCPFEKN